MTHPYVQAVLDAHRLYEEEKVLSQKLVIGRIVHSVSTKYRGDTAQACYPAIIVRVKEAEVVDLRAFFPYTTGGFTAIHDHKDTATYTWHWLDECEAFTTPSTPKRLPGSWWVERGQGEYMGFSGYWVLMPDRVNFSASRRAVAQSIAESHNKALLDAAYKEVDFQ